MYNLIQTQRGKSEIVMTDSLPNVRNRMKTLRTSHKGKKIEYSIVKTEDKVKFQKEPHDRRWTPQ